MKTDIFGLDQLPQENFTSHYSASSKKDTVEKARVQARRKEVDRTIKQCESEGCKIPTRQGVCSACKVDERVKIMAEREGWE